MNKRIISGIAAMALVFSTAAIPAFADDEYDVNPNFAVGEGAEDDGVGYSVIDDANAAFDDDSASNTVVASEEPAAVSNVDDADCFYPGYGYVPGGYGFGYGYGYGYDFGKKPGKTETPKTDSTTTTTDNTTTTGSDTTTTNNNNTAKPKHKKGPSFYDVGKVNWFYTIVDDNPNYNAPKIKDHVYGYGSGDSYIPVFNWAAIVEDGVNSGKPTQAPVYAWSPFNWFGGYTAPKTCKVAKKTTKKGYCAKKKKAKATKKKANTCCKKFVYTAPTPAPRQVVYAPMYNFRTYWNGIYAKKPAPKTSNPLTPWIIWHYFGVEK